MTRNEFGGDRPQERTVGMNTDAGAQRVVNIHGEDIGALGSAPWASYGIVRGKLNEMRVTQTSPGSRSVRITPGWIFTGNSDQSAILLVVPEEFPLLLEDSHPTLPRVDLVLARRRYNNTDAITTIERHTGTPGGGVPTNPYTGNEDRAHIIAEISLPAGSGSIRDQDIRLPENRFSVHGENLVATEESALTTVTELPATAPNNKVVMLTPSLAVFDFQANKFYGMQANGDFLYVAAEFNVFGTGVNLVKRFNIETGAEDTGFTFSLESILPDRSDSTTSQTTPQGLGVNDETIYISKYRSSGAPDVYAFDHSGNRVPAREFDFPSNADQLNAVAATNTHLYMRHIDNQSIWRYNLDGSGRTQQAPNNPTGANLQSGLDVVGDKYYITTNDNKIRSGTLGDTSTQPTVVVESLTTGLNPRALALIDETFVVGGRDGGVDYKSTGGIRGDFFIRLNDNWVKIYTPNV